MNFKIYTAKYVAALTTEKEAAMTLARGLETEVTNLKNMSRDMTEAQAEHNNVIAALKLEHDTALTTLKTNNDNAIAALKSDYETKLTALKADSDKALATLKADTDKTISDLTNQVKEASTSSEAKAISTLAKIGITQDQLPETVNAPTNKEIVSMWLALSGNERIAFYNKNRDVILTEAKLKQ